MRVALVSDVHGNAVALETVIAELEREPPDAVVCLGDLIQGGPDPGRCADLVQERGWPVVLGNADAFVLDVASAASGVEAVTERQLAQRAWTLEQLSEDQRAFVASFRPTVELGVGPRTLLACHAVPASFDPVVLPSTPEEEFRAHLDGVEADLVAAGHVHLQFVRRAGATLWISRAALVSRTTTSSRRTTSASTRGRHTGSSLPRRMGAWPSSSAASGSTSMRSSRASRPAGCPRPPTARGAGSRASDGNAL